MRKGWLSLGGVVLLAIVGWAQTYGPGEIYYGGIRLQFSGQVLVAGTCSAPVQLAPGVSQIQCQVPEGVAGTIELTATRTPAGAVNVRAERVPFGWPNSLWTQQLGQWVDSRSSVASGWGTITAQYRFAPPAGSAGRQVELRFKAWTAGVIGELELRVILDIVRGVTPTPPPTELTTPPTYGPFTGTTDGTGRFEVPIPTLPNTAMTGKLTECTVKILPNREVSVTLVPKTGITTISRADQIGAVRVSSPGYGEVAITELRLLSSMDMFGRVYTTVDVGTVCLRLTGPAQPVTPTAPISGKTDAEGKFTVSLPWPGTTVSGRLTECTVKPLPNQEFTLTLVPKGETIASPEDIAGFTFSVHGYRETTATKFSRLSLFGLTSYLLGDVCLLSPSPEPKILLLRVAERSFAPVYFLQQTVDELLRFRIEAVPGSKVEALRAKLVCLPVSRVHAVGPNTSVALPEEWLKEQLQVFVPDIAANWDKVKETDWSWKLPVPFDGAFGTFDKLTVERRDRVGDTPINEDTWFRVQEKELDKLKIRGGDSAIGYWEMEAEVRTPDGVLHRIRSAFYLEKEITLTIVEPGPTGKDEETAVKVTVRFPHLYQVFSDDVDVYELQSWFQITARATQVRQPTVQQNYSLVRETFEMRHTATTTSIDLFAKVDLREWVPSPQLVFGGNFMVIGNPLSLIDLRNAEISTRGFHICPAVGDDDLPVETEARVTIFPPGGSFQGEVTLEHGDWTMLAQELLEEFIPMILTGIAPSGLREFVLWAADKLMETARDKLIELIWPEYPTIMEGYASVYQAVISESGDPNKYYLGRFTVVPPRSSAEGDLGYPEKIECTWKSEGRPRYRMATGAAVAAIIMGRADKIKNLVVTAQMKVELSGEGLSSRWLIRDHDSKDGTPKHDPNPNSTWK